MFKFAHVLFLIFLIICIMEKGNITKTEKAPKKNPVKKILYPARKFKLLVLEEPKDRLIISDIKIIAKQIVDIKIIIFFILNFTVDTLFVLYHQLYL